MGTLSHHLSLDIHNFSLLAFETKIHTGISKFQMENYKQQLPQIKI